MRNVALAILALTCALSAHAQQRGGIDWSPVNLGIGAPYVYQYITVGPGDYILQPGVPQCGDRRDTRVGEAAQALATAVLYKTGFGAVLAQQGGALFGQFITQYQYEARGTGGSIAQLFSDIGASPRYAACGTVALVVPQGYHITQVQAFAKNWNVDWLAAPVSSTLCNVQSEPYLKCVVPDGAWRLTQAGNVVVGVFINWARETRDAYVSVSFAPN